MLYAREVNQEFAYGQSVGRAMDALDAGVVGSALALRDDMMTAQVLSATDDVLHLNDIDPSDRWLFGTRVLGGMSVRLAIGSTYALSSRNDIGSFDQLSSGEQLLNLQHTARYFSNQLSRQLTSDMTLTDYIHNPAAYPHINAVADPITAVSNAYVRNQVFAAKLAVMPDHYAPAMSAMYRRIPSMSPAPQAFSDISIADNDSILVQAFGRNGYSDSQLADVRADRERKQSDMHMMDYLQQQDFDPGAANYALAGEVNVLMHDKSNIEPIMQWEVAFALWQSDSNRYEQLAPRLHTVWPRPGATSYRTYEVKHDSIDIMDKINVYNPVELAHPAMIVRALAILARQGVIADPMLTDIPYDKGSSQLWTRGAGVFGAYEFATRVHHSMNGLVDLNPTTVPN
jgi:hypothetical protein